LNSAQQHDGAQVVKCNQRAPYLVQLFIHPSIEGELFKEKKYTIHPLRVSISKKSTDCFYEHFGFQNACPSF
jgi:hypothetical protein